jgi:hypothetical protein
VLYLVNPLLGDSASVNVRAHVSANVRVHLATAGAAENRGVESLLLALYST